MSDIERNNELDDELLSAYLDDELSADERAAVEARLAADPAAQQLLHELRSVSQSVQALPLETLGRDVSKEVVRRAREARPALSSAAKSQSGATEKPSLSADPLPKFTVFGSRRAWIWASLALAAGLLIMFVESGDESANKLPPVAQRKERAVENQPADESGQNAERKLADATEPQSPPPATVATDNGAPQQLGTPKATMPSEPRFELHDGPARIAPEGPPIAAAAPAPSKDAGRFDADHSLNASMPAAGTSSVDKLANSPSPGGQASAISGGLSTSGGRAKPKSENRAKPFFVVHVVARPEALQNKTFDQLLARQSITVEPQPPKEPPTAFGGGRLPQQANTETAAKRMTDKTERDQDADIVLVEAPRATIIKCLAALHDDSSNYVRVETEDGLQSSDRAEPKSSPANKRLDELNGKSRGVAAQGQRDSLDRYEEYYKYLSEPMSEHETNGSASSGSLSAGAGGPALNGDEKTDAKSPQPYSLGRARRVPMSDTSRHEVGQRRSGGGELNGQDRVEALKKPAPQRMLDEERLKQKTDDWKVLFVFSPEPAAPSSAPAENRPK